MKISKRVRTGYALALAGILALPGLSLLTTQAAGAIDTGAKCSLTVTVEESEYAKDFNDMSIPVAVYKVADVDSVGKYTAAGAFAGMDFSKISSNTTAEEWMELGKQAEEIRVAAEPVPEPSGEVTVQKEAGSTEPAKGTIRDLATGMYLVVPAETYNKDYTVKYVFNPYLTALPGNPYVSSGGEGSDEWDYNPVIGLKAEGEPQTGKLIITKVLTNYNETLGKTSFVFEITGKDSTGKVVYSNVVSTTHEGPGEQSVTLEGLPAGITVTVKEVYSGASYTLDGSGEADALIWSDAAVDAGLGETASVTFRNKYDGGNRGGYGVTNQFDSDGNGGWNWENPTEGLPEENN